MKKSTRVTLTVVAAVGLASCGRRRMDPCQPSYFNQQACQEAIDGRGYYWGGTWYPMVYSHPYPYYFDSYRSYTSGGGRVYTAPSEAYRRSTTTSSGGSSATGSSSSSTPSSGVTRGGFGSTGSSHGSSSG